MKNKNAINLGTIDVKVILWKKTKLTWNIALRLQDRAGLLSVNLQINLDAYNYISKCYVFLAWY